MKTTILFTVLCLLALSAQLNAKAHSVNLKKLATSRSSTTDFGSALNDFLVAFKDVMPCGFQPWSMPILSPWTYKDYAFDFSNASQYSVSGDLDNIFVTGMAGYEIIEMDYDTSTMTTSFDLNFPQLQFLSEYQMKAWALFAGYPMSMVGEGVMNWRLTDYRLVGNFTFAPNNANTGLQLSNIHMNLYLGDIQQKNWNSYWDISFNNFLNNWARESILMYVEQIQPAIDDMLRAQLLPSMNSLLQNTTMDQLVAILRGATTQLNLALC